MPKQKNCSGDNSTDWLVDEITALAEAFGEGLTGERITIYAKALEDVPAEQLRQAIRVAIRELKWFPKVAELRELAGILSGTVDDGRPGPEEAWARMPKGDHMEDDSVVWCEEERIAYGACRSLLLEGDQIGARMAFKERYEKELAESRSQGKRVQWSMSAGYDVEHRLATLAKAVCDKRLSLNSALNFVPGERQNDFAQMLPPGEARGLLAGKVEKGPNLPGFVGMLAKMQMDGTLPEDLKAVAQSSQKTPEDRTPEESLALREKAKAQIEFLKRSRNGSGSDAA